MVRITGIALTAFALPGTRAGVAASEPACAVEIEASELVGVAIAPAHTIQALRTLADTLLLGEDARAVTGLWARMQDYCSTRGLTGPWLEALSSLDLALWDLKAKARDEPLWRTLGGARPNANAHFSDGGADLDDDALASWCMTTASDYGFGSAQLIVTGDARRNQSRLDALHKAVRRNSAAPTLLLAARHNWAPKDAVRAISALERDFDIAAVEAPCTSWDFLGCKRVSDGVRAAIINSAQINSPGAFLPFFDAHALDIVQGGVASGGVTGLLQLADAAYGFELPFILSRSPGNVLAHLAGALPYFQSIEIVDPAPGGGVFTTDVHIKGGRAYVGDAPGCGLAFDKEALRQAAIEVAGATP